MVVRRDSDIIRHEVARGFKVLESPVGRNCTLRPGDDTHIAVVGDCRYVIDSTGNILCRDLNILEGIALGFTYIGSAYDEPVKNLPRLVAKSSQYSTLVPGKNNAG